MTLQKNPYHSPMLTDGDLLLRAEYLLRKCETLVTEIQCLSEQNTTHEREVYLLNAHYKLKLELSMVLEALEENCYDTSGFKVE